MSAVTHPLKHTLKTSDTRHAVRNRQQTCRCARDVAYREGMLLITTRH